VDGVVISEYLRIKKGYPGSIYFGPGFFIFKPWNRSFRNGMHMNFIHIIKHYLLWSIPFWLLMATNVAAAGPDQEPYTLDTIVVTSKRTDENFLTGDVDTEQTPAFYSLIEREAFEGKMEDLAEVVEKEAGVQVRQAGGLGSFSTVSLRGSSSEQVMIFVDGILLNDASGGGVDLSNITLSDIESIEIYRGITSMNFGKASIGGVINIKTLRVEKDLIVNARAGMGSFDTQKYAAFINHKPGRWDYLVSADYLDTENDFKILNDNGTVWNLEDDLYEKRNNAQVTQENLLAKVGFDITDNLRFDFVDQWFSKDQGLPSWNNSETSIASIFTERNITNLKLTTDNIGSHRLNTFIRITASNKEEEYNDSHGSIGLGQQHSIYSTDRYGADLFLEWLTEKNSLNLLLNFQREEYGVVQRLRQVNPNDSTRATLSTGIQDSMFFFNSRLTVTSGLRYTLIDDELNSAVNAFGVPLEGRSEQNDYMSPQIGIKYYAADWLTFKSNIAKYFREPSFFELFGDRGFFLGNNELKAEEGKNYDAGLEINLASPVDWLPRITVNAAWFVSDVDNLITRAYDSRGVGKSVNISSSFVDGIEADVHVDFFKYFRVSANATRQNAENRSEIDAFNGKKLPGIFERSYLARLESNYKGFKVYFENVREEGLYYDTANLIRAQDKVESNAGVSWLYRSFQFNIEAKNLGDNLYEDFNGYPLPGRSWYFSVKYTL
jgi:iron complex outermembrane receptor protein